MPTVTIHNKPARVIITETTHPTWKDFRAEITHDTFPILTAVVEQETFWDNKLGTRVFADVTVTIKSPKVSGTDLVSALGQLVTAANALAGMRPQTGRLVYGHNMK